ncbi:MAG: hypothetical protein EBU49_01030 [Proteobacteria bacterium]|nr:hypothetical protein [Pseudomonadota bacterium]
MKPEDYTDQSSSPLAEAAVHALSVYVSLGDKAIEMLGKGQFDEAAAALERRKAVLHNFRVIDARMLRQGYSAEGLAQIERLGLAAISIDSAVHDALVREHASLCLSMTDVASRKKIAKYRSGQPDRPVVEQGI